MTGPEHYAEAEKDIDRANGATIDDGLAAFFLARAQVHAALALAAARGNISTTPVRDFIAAVSS